MKCKSLSLVSLTLLAFACTDSKTASYTQAEIDRANSLVTRYGLKEMPLYDELLNFKTVETKDAAGNPKLPWTDTYWATTNKNLAARWGYINSKDEANLDPFSEFKIGAYFQTQVDALKTSEKVLSVNLSPAEKFDIAFRSTRNVNFDGENTVLKSLLELDKGHDDFLKPELQANDRIVSKRVLAGKYNEILSGSENLDEYSPLAAEGYRNWLANSLNESNLFPGEETEGAMDWSWEGICHGWAPAAVMSEEPKHAVKVQVKTSATESKELLFTEGDIRALLDKSWADASNPEQFFIGRRCEANLADPKKGVPSNEQGRAVTGSMTYVNEAGMKVQGQFTVVQEFPRTSGRVALYRVILENEWKDGQAKYAYLIERWNGRTNFTALSFDEKEAFAAFEAQNIPQKIKPVEAIEFFGCWDVNPASFHTVLVENLGKKNLGFVMDRTQSGQVWNQPIGKAEFVIGDLKETATLTTDKAKEYRAPGTKYIAEVKATVYWSAEPNLPMISYTVDGQDFDAKMLKHFVYEYTLEFDADKRLIGGEWGTLDTFKTHENPDFLFGYTKKVEPNLSVASWFLNEGYRSVIKKIHDCSLQGEVKGEMTVEQDSWDRTISHKINYVECQL